MFVWCPRCPGGGTQAASKKVDRMRRKDPVGWHPLALCYGHGRGAFAFCDRHLREHCMMALCLLSATCPCAWNRLNTHQIKSLFFNQALHKRLAVQSVMHFLKRLTCIIWLWSTKRFTLGPYACT